MSKQFESVPMELAPNEDPNRLILGAYHRYACEGVAAWDDLQEVREGYVTFVASNAERLEATSMGKGIDSIQDADRARKQRLLSIVAPNRYQNGSKIGDLFFYGVLGASIAGKVSPVGTYVMSSYAVLNYAERKEEYRYSHFKGLLDQYYQEIRTHKLSFSEIVGAKVDTEIRYISEVVHPELAARRKRIVGRALLAGAGLAVYNSVLG